MFIIMCLISQTYWDDNSRADFLGGSELWYAGSSERVSGLGVNFWASSSGLRVLGQDYDLNNDASLDEAVFGAAANTARILYGPGFGTDTRFTTSSAEGMGVADLNGNGVPDVVVGEQWGSQSYIYWDMNPASVTQLGFGGACYGVAIGDLNKDGSLDLVLAGYGGVQSKIYWGPCYTTYQAFDNADSWDPFVADLNLDGYPDIVLPRPLSTIKIFWGPGFTSSQDIAFSSTKAAAVADLNADGWPDVALGSYSEGVRVYFGPGFSSYWALAGMTNVQDLEIEDADGDGYLDLVASGGSDGKARIWWGPALVSFTDVSAAAGDGVDLLDLDNDGDLDIATSSGTSSFYIYRNNGSRSFSLWQNISLPSWGGAYVDLRKYEEIGNAYTRTPSFVYLSRIFTGSSAYRMDSLRWWASVPSGMTLRLWLRASDDQTTWTSWKEVYNGQGITDPDFFCRRFYQYSALVTTDGRRTSEFHLDSLRLYYTDCAIGLDEFGPADYLVINGGLAYLNVVAECGYLLVYDITGRPIKEFHLARGKHAIAWAEGLPSGLYILIARYDGTERVKSAFVR
ncbi:MAG: VCBS repeat-containing protein [candidate division WOR-3 bacterium]